VARESFSRSRSGCSLHPSPLPFSSFVVILRTQASSTHFPLSRLGSLAAILAKQRKTAASFPPCETLLSSASLAVLGEDPDRDLALAEHAVVFAVVRAKERPR
jgi:hypothetical protein